MSSFTEELLQGIPSELPSVPPIPSEWSRAPKRPCPLTSEEKVLAVRNALRYIPSSLHTVLAKECVQELNEYGHIYFYRYRPAFEMKARPLKEIPHKSTQAAAIILMILNNLDPAVAQHPAELITYGGNGGVFQHWAQFRLTIQYLTRMTDEQTLVLYSGHPLGLFPSSTSAPRVVVTNGMMIPRFSTEEEYHKRYALGVTQYGQMTAGSFMYIGPQGIVHGTALTVLNAARKVGSTASQGISFVSSGLGGMSGAQAKGGKIAGVTAVVAELDERPLKKRFSQGWVDEVFSDLEKLLLRLEKAKKYKEAVSLAYHGNVVDLWEFLARKEVPVELGSDQTSLHNPFGGGYYPVGVSFTEARTLLANDPIRFRSLVRESLKRQVEAINKLSLNGMYFFDYGNGFLLQSSRAGAAITTPEGNFRYPSYVEDLMGPLCFDYGFGPFRWVCSSCNPEDLRKTDLIAAAVLKEQLKDSSLNIHGQLQDNIKWIEEAEKNALVVGSQARILYANEEGRVRLAQAFNRAIAQGEITAPIILGRDHHDVSGTDSPFRETANIKDGSNVTADMAVQNVIGDSFRGATWISLHNGGGVGWGEVINGGFGLVLDGTEAAEARATAMLSWDVLNGVSRRAWAGNHGALETARGAVSRDSSLEVTLPFEVDNEAIRKVFE